MQKLDDDVEECPGIPSTDAQHHGEEGRRPEWSPDSMADWLPKAARTELPRASIVQPCRSSAEDMPDTNFVMRRSRNTRFNQKSILG